MSGISESNCYITCTISSSIVIRSKECFKACNYRGNEE